MTGDSFAHKLRIDAIRDGERIELSASAAERSEIAARLGLNSLDRLEAQARLSRSGAEIRAEGRLMAALCQACVITGEPVTAAVDEPFDLRFVPEPAVAQPDEEIELGSADCDTVFHDGATIDLGGAVADTLALAIDPYPRSAGAEAALKEAGIMTEVEASPFAALAKLMKPDET
jgi:uncharacterized metal-binding protein YceD (DUF177 family)